MYKSFFLITVFVLISYVSSAQYLYPEKFNGCVLGFGLDLGNPKAKMPDNFTQQLTANLDANTLTTTQGFIEIQVLIDTLGRPCLLSANNKTNSKSKGLKLQTAINTTPNWEPAIYYGTKTDVCIMLLLEFKNGTITVERIKFDTSKIKNK